MIRIRNLRKAFGPKIVLDGVDLDIEAGETHVVIGRSGEGKSVLLKHLCGLMRPDWGEVEVDGRFIDPRKPGSIDFLREKVSMVFQMAALFDSMTVRENVGFYHDERGIWPRERVDALVERLLDEVNLPNTGHLMPAELSGGMRKRVGLARALAKEPEIILYDEPTTGLDPVTSDVINNLIMDTRARRRVTSIVVTHDMASAFKISDRISMIFEGRIIFTGTAEQVRTTTNEYVRQFVLGLAEGPMTRKESAAALRAKAAEKATRPGGRST